MLIDILFMNTLLMTEEFKLPMWQAISQVIGETTIDATNLWSIFVSNRLLLSYMWVIFTNRIIIIIIIIDIKTPNKSWVHPYTYSIDYH